MSSRVQLPPPAAGKIDLLVIAGEHSGDQHGAAMIRGALAKNPGLKIAALGGPEIAASGAQLLYDLTATSVVGFVEVLAHARFFLSLGSATLSWIKEYQPRAVCFIDYPGFNLRLAEAMRVKGLSTKGGGDIAALYYISPQIWAWKACRRFDMAATLDALAVIFPFEVACYADTRLPVSFVGHPFISGDYAAPVSYDPAGPILLLPGSRRQAVKRIFPVLLNAFESLSIRRDAVVLYPSDAVRSVLEAAKPPPSVSLQKTGTPVAASAVLTSSGTMSMHCALAGIPGAIVYRTNPITYFFGRLLVKTEYIGIANLLLRRPMYPEFIQGDARAALLAAELYNCLTDRERRAVTASMAAQLHEILRQPSSGTASDWLLQRLKAVSYKP
ncbi:MAG: lipid-A-disaccharide synthase [Opitutaceae bacterium]